MQRSSNLSSRALSTTRRCLLQPPSSTRMFIPTASSRFSLFRLPSAHVISTWHGDDDPCRRNLHRGNQEGASCASPVGQARLSDRRPIASSGRGNLAAWHGHHRGLEDAIYFACDDQSEKNQQQTAYLGSSNQSRLQDLTPKVLHHRGDFPHLSARTRQPAGPEHLSSYTLALSLTSASFIA